MRLDQALVARGLARSRNQAARLISSGRVTVSGETVRKASLKVSDEPITCEAERYVSRAAYKLIGALDESRIEIPARVLDAGASTGGFTQVLLERGAGRVYAVDVGHGQLVAELLSDPRVVVHEGLNLRDLRLTHLEGRPVDLIVGDISFISLTILLPALVAALAPGGRALLLIKPQFEVGRALLNSAGVVASEQARQEGIAKVLEAAGALDLALEWEGDSVLPGGDGNLEHFALFRRA